MATQEQETREPKTPEQRSSAKSEAIERRPETAAARRGGYGGSPFSLMRRLSEDMDRLFADFFGPSLFRGDRPDQVLSGELAETAPWPEIEVQHTGNKLVIEADVPGIRKDDIGVEVRDGELCIFGERRSESERREGRYYRTERSYGSFYRAVPLPEGAKPDTASATFDNGVLKIEMEAPGGGQGRGRRIEVREGSPH